MSAGCAVVGYHGHGGLEYATEKNGFWHYNDEIEKIVDDLYRVIIAIQHDDPAIHTLIAEGRATAAGFNAQAMRGIDRVYRVGERVEWLHSECCGFVDVLPAMSFCSMVLLVVIAPRV